MTYVVSFDDFTPSPRFDVTVWTRVRIEEGATADGTFVQIDDQALSPLDSDPTNPRARDLTTANAALASGWYRVVFYDADGNEQPTAPVQHDTERANYMPAVSDIGALLRARTKATDDDPDNAGQELGTFTSYTRPTGAEVNLLIDMMASTLGDLYGDIPDPLWDSASTLVALRTALLVELSYFPEDVENGNSAYAQLLALYTEAASSFKVAIERERGDEGIGVMRPVWRFARPLTPTVGLRTPM